jgi:hypothetical protein
MPVNTTKYSESVTPFFRSVIDKFKALFSLEHYRLSVVTADASGVAAAMGIQDSYQLVGCHETDTDYMMSKITLLDSLEETSEGATTAVHEVRHVFYEEYLWSPLKILMDLYVPEEGRASVDASISRITERLIQLDVLTLDKLGVLT